MKTIVSSAFALLMLAAVTAWADLSVSDYCALTTERLTLSADTWETGQRGALAPDAEAALWGRYSTSAEEYYGYMSAHGSQVEAYFAENPGVKQQIDSLSARIRELISHGDASP
jgi:hypothetical protein